MDVLSSKVRHEFLIIILLVLEDDAGLAFLRTVAEFLGSEEQPKLKRHVKPWQCRSLVQFCLGNIVDAKIAFGNDLAYFAKTIVAAVVRFKRTAGFKSRADDDKNDGVEVGQIVFAKGTIDENVPIAHLFLSEPAANVLSARDLTLATAAAICRSVTVEFPLGDFKIATPSLVIPATAYPLRFRLLNLLALIIVMSGILAQSG